MRRLCQHAREQILLKNFKPLLYALQTPLGQKEFGELAHLVVVSAFHLQKQCIESLYLYFLFSVSVFL